jgi:dihydrolipoamide dehydrogenase
MAVEMAALGVRILTGHRVLAVEPGIVLAEERASGEVERMPTGQVLVAAGRRPVIESGMFDRLGIGYTAKGITVDDALRTTVPGVWAIGDATGKSILAHAGIQQGIIAAENIMCGPDGPFRLMGYDAIPTAVYSIPEVAAVGRVPPPDELVDFYPA